MEIRLNREQIRDKIHACWIGKNIGGTMGTPYEGKREVQDISGFSSPKGEPLPNDDLDLQLVWLTAMEQEGPHQLSANLLSDYWVSYIPPHWNEYGIGKSNLKMGLLPPLSGEFCNESWKNSNGAWIRSEIWACMAPGFPYVAMKYAMMDACIDHGLSEGTYAEMFTAAMESLAFFETDVRTVIEKALRFIPEDCRVACSVRLVISEYEKGTPWREVREKVVEESKDLGWFQAPGNLGFVVLGLLYGEGDFKKSLIYAIDCGDDTDCTGATCGALLGILGGTAAIPQDWKEYIGDRIIMVAADASYGRLPRSCTDLTERVCRMIPCVLNAHHIHMEYTDGETVYDPQAALDVAREECKWFMERSPYSFDIASPHTRATVEYFTEPVIRPGDSFKLRVRLRNLLADPRHVDFSVYLPEGWSAAYPRTVYLTHKTANTSGCATWEMELTAGERVEPTNKLVIYLSSASHPLPLLLPVVLLG
ncbi:MAG: ADP-ribosylglycohydrolase family protein [Provencibacterium sp.]|nr:ADP-ribosylglycohydrolase family protein [Provencibacterium sp.]